MRSELKKMFEGMQDALLDAESLSVFGGDTKPCAVSCIDGCSSGCAPSCSDKPSSGM